MEFRRGSDGLVGGAECGGGGAHKRVGLVGRGEQLAFVAGPDLPYTSGPLWIRWSRGSGWISTCPFVVIRFNRLVCLLLDFQIARVSNSKPQFLKGSFFSFFKPRVRVFNAFTQRIFLGKTWTF